MSNREDFELSKIALKLKDYKSAKLILEGLILQEPANPSYYFYLGICFSSERDTLNTVNCFRKAIEYCSYWAQPYFFLGHYFLVIEDPESAKKVFHSALNLPDESLYSLMNRGSFYYLDDNYKKALVYFDELNIEELPDIVAFQLASFRFDKMDYENAIPYYLRGICISEAHVHFINNLGVCYLKTGDYVRAQERFKQCIEIEPDNARFYFNLGNVYAALERFRTAKQFYQKALELDPSYPGTYIALFDLPIESFDVNEVFGINYLFAAIFKTFTSTSNIEQLVWWRSHLPSLINIAIGSDTPMLVYHLFGNIYFDTPVSLLVNPTLNKIARVTKPFRQQFALWEKVRILTNESYLVEAIMNYNLGDPIRCYQIFDRYIEDTLESPIPLVGQYYFALSASAILQPHHECLINYALPQANNALFLPEVSNVDKYYAALILSLANQIDSAIAALDALVKANFFPARYARAEILKRQNSTDVAFQTKTMAELYDFHHNDKNYFSSPKCIVIDSDERSMLTSMMPLLNLLENKSVIEALKSFNIYHEESFIDTEFFFASHIEFDHLRDIVSTDTLERNNPIIYNQIYGSQEEKELIIPEIEIFRIKEKMSSGILHFTDLLHKSAFTDFAYVKQGLTVPPNKTNYRHYMVLAISLYEDRLITESQLHLLEQYIVYCAESVYSVSHKSEFLEIAINELKDSFIKFSLFGIGYGTLEGIYCIVYDKIKGKQSEILTYNQFVSHLKNRNPDLR